MEKDEFIEKAKAIHGGKYDYSKVEYKSNKTKVCIVCPIHGEFWQVPNSHLSSHGCPKCGVKYRSEKKSYSKDTFIDRAKLIFPQYDYSLLEYVNSHTKIKLICPIHGEFEIKPYHLLNGHGCKKCGQILTHDKQRKTKEEFIEEAKKIHGDKYDYSKVNYVNTETKVCIRCLEHGDFWITPHAHLSGKQGCPVCKESQLEKEMRLFLSEKNIKHINKKHFDWLGQQHLDFYLPEYNVAIECQGIQHFQNVEYFGGNKSFIERLERDSRKKKLCDENNVPILYYSSFKYKGVYTDKELLLKDIIL
jgi:hypothetical protein